jgi:polysaccharide biosynthesis/export protein
MRWWQLLTIVGVGMTVSGALGDRSTATPAAPPPLYCFAAGDVIEVTVTPQRSFDRMVTVEPDGKISYPLLGRFPVAGLTVEQLAHKIRERLNRDLVDPQVTVSVKEMNRRAVGRVSLLGEITKPGAYEIDGETRLLDVLLQAGGPTPRADLRRVTLAHSGAPGARTLDLQPLLAQGKTTDPELNVLLQPGDTVFIAETEQQIYVLGSVDRPGIYAIKPGARVLDALVNAGGAGAGASKAVLVRRDGNGRPVQKPLDLKKIMAKGDMKENALVQPGDVLYVPDKKSSKSGAEALGMLWPLTGLINLFR